MTMMEKMDIIYITSITAKPIEIWAAQWSRNAKLQFLSHPRTTKRYLMSKIIRQAHEGEYNLRGDCWNKVHRHYPKISRDTFDEVFHSLINQFYHNLKLDMDCLRQDEIN